jgi:hypothetical protein
MPRPLGPRENGHRFPLNKGLDGAKALSRYFGEENNFVSAGNRAPNRSDFTLVTIPITRSWFPLAVINQ